MKLFPTQLGIMTILVGVLIPIPVLSYSLNRTEAIEQPRAVVLAQVASYRYLVDAANKQEKLANRASDRYLATFRQFINTPGNRSLNNVLIQTSGQAAVYLQRSGKF